MIYGGNVKMAKGSSYRVHLRRRREGKTDYQARKALVTSRKPRLVTRASIKNVEVQIIIAKPHGDEVLASANSRELIKSYGWRAPTGNIPASYLTGLLCGVKAKAAGIKEAILDIGLVSPTKGSKIFAVLSGVVDAGVEVPHSEEKIVKERMKGEHIAKYAKSLGANSEEYTAKFSQYTAQGVAPEKIVEHFTKVKADIIAVSKGAKLPEVVVAPKTAAKEKAPKLVVEVPPKEKAPVKAKEKKLADVKPVKEKSAAKAPKAKVSKAKAPKAKTTKEKDSKSTTETEVKALKEKAPKEKVTKKGGKKA
jgi:large subunit ribosomal protein L18